MVELNKLIPLVLLKMLFVIEQLINFAFAVFILTILLPLFFVINTFIKTGAVEV